MLHQDLAILENENSPYALHIHKIMRTKHPHQCLFQCWVKYLYLVPGVN